MECCISSCEFQGDDVQGGAQTTNWTDADSLTDCLYIGTLSTWSRLFESTLSEFVFELDWTELFWDCGENIK